MSTFDAKDRAEDNPLGPPPLSPLPFIPPVIHEIAAALDAQPGVSLCDGGPRLDLAHAPLEDAWREAYSASIYSGSGLIVHFAGHGIKGATDHSLYLAARDTDPASPAWTAIDIDRWLKQAESTQKGPPVLFLLDVCDAGRVPNQQWLQGLSANRRRAWVIAASSDSGTAYGGRFSRATVSVLKRLKAGWLDLSPSLRHVPMETFAQEIDRELARLTEAEDKPPQRVTRTAHTEADAPVPPLLKNPAFRETAAGRFRQHVESGLWQFASAADPALDVVHFVSRASGSPLQLDVTRRCFFTGRHRQLQQLKDWLEADSRKQKIPVKSLMVVTGSPGSGKSALLGVVTCLAHQKLQEVSGPIRACVPRYLRVERQRMLAAVHARQRTPSDVLTSIANQLGLGPAPSQGWSADMLLDRLYRLALSDSVIVIVDALDEASLDQELLRSVLLPLARAPQIGQGMPVCKVLVGVRPWWDQFPELRVDSPQSEVIDLDRAPEAEREGELGDYLTDLLEEVPAYSGPGTSAVREGLARAVAPKLNRLRHGGGFLLTSLFAHYLAELGTSLTVGEALHRVPDNLPGMLELHLGILARDRPTLRPVLSALAHGLGQGMPLEIIQAVAGALTLPGQEAPNLDDTQDAIEAISFYIRSAVDTDGRRLYRFFHQSLTDYLASAADHHAVFEAVLGTVPGRDEHGERIWDLALPYVLRHAAQHAVAAERFDELLKSPGFLVHADPTILKTQSPYARSLRARQVTQVISSALVPRTDPDLRWQWLRNNAVTAHEDWLVRGLDTLRGIDTQDLPSAALALQWGSRIREPGWSKVLLDAAFAETDAGPIAVTAHADGDVHLWDTETGGVLQSLIEGGDETTALAAGSVHNTAVVATGDTTGKLTLWSVDRRIAWTASLLYEVIAIAIGTLRGKLVVAAATARDITLFSATGDRLWSVDLEEMWLRSAGRDADWDLQTLLEIPECTAVAVAEFDGVPAVIAGTSVGTVELWDADGSNHRSQQVHSGVVHSVAPSRDGMTRRVLACSFGSVKVLDAEDGSARELSVGQGQGRAVAAFDAAGDEYVAVGCGNRLEIHSLRDGSVRAHPCPEETTLRVLSASGPRLLAVAESLRHDAIVLNRIDSAGRFASWEGHDCNVISAGLVGHQGQQFAVSLSNDGVFHTWDVEDGLCLYSGRTADAVFAIAGTTNGTPVAVLYDRQGSCRAVGMIDGSVQRSWTWPTDLMDLSWFRYRGGDVLCGWDPYDGLLVADAARPEKVRTYHAVGSLSAYTVGDVGPLSVIALATSDGFVKVKSETGTQTFAYDTEQTALALGLNADRPILVAVSSEGLITGRDLLDGHEVFSLPTGHSDVLSVDTMAHGQSFYAVSASPDGTISVWAPFDDVQQVGQVEVSGELSSVVVSRKGVLAAFGSRVSYFSWLRTGGQQE
ncbi:AAA family ATPase [Streptomyces sp. YKOK-I1]